MFSNAPSTCHTYHITIVPPNRTATTHYMCITMPSKLIWFGTSRDEEYYYVCVHMYVGGNFLEKFGGGYQA